MEPYSELIRRAGERRAQQIRNEAISKAVQQLSGVAPTVLKLDSPGHVNGKTLAWIAEDEARLLAGPTHNARGLTDHLLFDW